MNVPCGDDREKRVHALGLSVIKVVFDDASALVIRCGQSREGLAGKGAK